MKSSILTEARVVVSYTYVVIQLANVCQKCVICQTKQPEAVNKGAAKQSRINGIITLLT